MLQSSARKYPVIVFDVQNSQLNVNVKPWANIIAVGMYGLDELKRNFIPGRVKFPD